MGPGAIDGAPNETSNFYGAGGNQDDRTYRRHAVPLQLSALGVVVASVLFWVVVGVLISRWF